MEQTVVLSVSLLKQDIQEHLLVIFSGKSPNTQQLDVPG